MSIKADPKANIPDMNSMDIVWIQWYDDLKAYFGKQAAKSIWVMFWNKRGGKASKANTTNLRTAMEEKGIEIDASFFGSVKDTSISVVSGAADWVGDIFGGAKTVLWVTCGVVVLFLGSIVYRNMKTGEVNKGLTAALTRNPAALK